MVPGSHISEKFFYQGRDPPITAMGHPGCELVRSCNGKLSVFPVTYEWYRHFLSVGSVKELVPLAVVLL